MRYTHARIIDLIQHTIATTTGEGCSVNDAEQLLTEWQQAN